MAYEVKANWTTIDPETLAPETFKAYHEYKRLYREMKSAREAFELSMSIEVQLPATQRLVFGYNFGKLSVAIVPNDKPAPRAAKSAGSLADFLAAQRAQGKRT